MSHFKLDFGAFDFVVSEQDQWTFLECNPDGQWLFLDDDTTHDITQAMANYLESFCND